MKFVLGLNRLPENLKGKRICKITPNSFGYIVKTYKKKVKVTEVFFATPRFGEALALNLAPFAYLQETKQFKFSLAGIVGFIFFLFFSKFTALAFIGTTTSFYSGAGDGYVGNSNANWATCKGAATGDNFDYTTEGTAGGAWPQATLYLGVYYIRRGFFPIDTSGIGADKTVSAASFTFTVGAAGYYNDDNTDFRLVQTSQASNIALANADFDAVTFVQDGTAAFTTGVKTITMTATGIAWISKTGFTKLGLVLGRDYDNVAPVGYNQGTIYTSEYTGTSNDPYLSATYDVTVTFIPKVMIF